MEQEVGTKKEQAGDFRKNEKICVQVFKKRYLKMIWNMYFETIGLRAFAETNRTELNTGSPRRTALEFFDYFCVFL